MSNKKAIKKVNQKPQSLNSFLRNFQTELEEFSLVFRIDEHCRDRGFTSDNRAFLKYKAVDDIEDGWSLEITDFSGYELPVVVEALKALVDELTAIHEAFKKGRNNQ